MRRNTDREPSTRDNNEVMKLRVECYSGRRADERPVRFWLEGSEYRVEAVLDQIGDFEHGLNAAINKLRDKLGDSARHANLRRDVTRSWLSIHRED